jgi:hypothetical protein
MFAQVVRCQITLSFFKFLDLKELSQASKQVNHSTGIESFTKELITTDVV